MSSDRASSTGPRRADGLRNRHRILAAARELFAQRPASEVQLEDVAAAAGVSRATLYRHIQSKDALINEIYHERVEDLEGLIALSLAAPTGWDGFVLMMRRTAIGMHEDRGLYQFSVGLYESARDDPRYARVGAGFEAVIARARQEGSIRDGVTVDDLLPLLGFSVAARRERVPFYTEVLLTGLRNGALAT